MDTPAAAAGPRLTIDVWADVLCPWCYLGEARLVEAIEASEHREAIDLRVHTFQLDPSATDEVRPTIDYLAAKFGTSVDEARSMEEKMAAMAAEDGLAYTADRPMSSTLDMLRLVKLADERDLGWEALFALQVEVFGGNPDAFDRATLERVASELGLAADEVSELLDGDRFADEVRADHEQAVRLGANGVPFTVLGERFGIPGAVGVEQYGQAIDQAWEKIHGS